MGDSTRLNHMVLTLQEHSRSFTILFTTFSLRKVSNVQCSDMLAWLGLLYCIVLYELIHSFIFTVLTHYYNLRIILYYNYIILGGGDAAFLKGYNVALAANFITGLISIVLGFFGMSILKIVPPAGLLVPIAGIGIAFLGLENIAAAASAPLIGYNTVLWVYLGWYAGVRLGYKKYRCPEALQVILIGTIMGWAIGFNKPEEVIDAAKLVKWYGPCKLVTLCIYTSILFSNN
jgi:hypothetical protein